MRPPEPPYTPPPGQMWVPVADTPRMWRAQPGHRCRYTVAKHTLCGAPSVAAANRQRTVHRPGGYTRRVDAWWAYCAAHVAGYGRWVADGRVWRWQLAPDGHDFFQPGMEVR
jgi:hypothetical protein